MNSLVLLKQTFDTEEHIEINDGAISENGVKFIINPYDEYSVEEAVQLKEIHGGEVTVISIGPSRAEEALRTALSMGADKAILIDPGDTHLDEYTIAEILKLVCQKYSYDIIFAGYMAIDDGSSQVGPRLAELLDLPHISTIVNLDVNDTKDKLVVERDVEGSTEIYEVSIPALLTTQQGLNEPRYPSIPNQMKAKRKPLETLTLEDLDFPEKEIVSPTSQVSLSNPPEKMEGKILEGTLNDQVMELTSILLRDSK